MIESNPIIRAIKNGRVKPEEKLEALRFLEKDDDAYVLKLLGKEVRLKAKLVHISETLDEAEKLVLHGDEIKGLSTGYPELDQMTRGINPSEIVLVIAETNVGKSQLCQNVVLNVARAGRTVMFIGLEMANAENSSRFIAMAGGRQELERLPILYPDPEQSLGYKDMASIVETAKEEGAELVVIDHLHMFQTDAANRANGLDMVCAELKSVARQYEVPILLAAQTNRGTERRMEAPIARDIRDSVAIEQIADIILALHKDPTEDPMVTALEVVVRKQRKGFRKRYTKFISDENARLKPYGVMDVLPGRQYI